MERPARPPQSNPAGAHANGLIETAANLNRTYVSWDSLRNRDLKLPAEDVWRAMASLRRSSGSSVRVGGTVFTWNVTPGMMSVMHRIDMRHSGGMLLAHRLNHHSKKAYAVSSAMEEAIGSALISGCMLQSKSVKKHMREERQPKNDYEAVAMRTYAALNLARSLSDQPLTPEILLRINEAETGLTGWRDSEDSEPEPHSREPQLTQFPVSRIRKAVDDMCAFAGDESVHPLIRAFSLEYMILRVQPFATGNGRTARAVASWCMARCGYGVDLYLAVSGVRRAKQSAYQRAFMTAEAEYDDMTYAVSFCTDATDAAMDNFLSYVDRKTREQDDVLEGVALNDLNPRQRSILTDVSKSQDGVTVEELAAKHQVTYQTARADLILLLTRGLVEKGPRDGHKDTYIRPNRED